jgi:metal-responsive CopG/Arc/MetJ family transcriptional regulator
METIKTAISIRKPLFEQADELARKMNVSRSRLFGLALEEYIRRQENQELLRELNAVYGDEPDPAEETLRAYARRSQRRIVDGEW